MEYAVFPNLPKVSDRYVVTILSKSIRKSLISNASNEVKNDQNIFPLSPDQRDHIEDWSKML